MGSLPGEVRPGSYHRFPSHHPAKQPLLISVDRRTMRRAKGLRTVHTQSLDHAQISYITYSTHSKSSWSKSLLYWTKRKSLSLFMVHRSMTITQAPHVAYCGSFSRT